jgi:hypothetical protein
MAELLDAPHSFSWMARGLLAQPTYGMFPAGEKKTLKSVIGDFIDIGLASGEAILGRFQVDQPGTVRVYIGEGGREPYTRRLERAAAAMGVALRDIPLLPSFEVAPIGSDRFEATMRRDLDELAPMAVRMDPLYPFHPLAGVNASNLLEEGTMLARLSVPCMAAGASFLLTSHFNKTGVTTGLERITQAGGQEWSDSWLLVSHRRDPDVDDGKFYLALEVGSRQWGGSTWDLDMDVGRFDEDRREYDGAISYDLRRSKGEAARSRSAVADIVARQPWSLGREELAKALGVKMTDGRRAVDESFRRGEIATREVEGRRSDGRRYTATVYGPSHVPDGTKLDEPWPDGWDLTTLTRTNGPSWHVPTPDERDEP